MSNPPDATLELRLIGGFELACDGVAVELADPARRLVAFLALRQKPQQRSFVAGNLWPDKPEPRALANLRSALWVLHGPCRSPVVDVNGLALGLSPAVRVDVKMVQHVGWSLIEHAMTADPTPVLAESGLLIDCEPLFDDLLPGWYDDWVLLERERFGELQVHILDIVLDSLTDTDRHSLAIQLALRLVAVDPLRERSQLALIRAYWAEGSFGRAQRQHRAYCELIEASFGRSYDRSFDDVIGDHPPRSRPPTLAAVR
jgi:DNA-binding SARP family transcriptional activator